MRLLAPTWVKEIDQYLLRNQPLIWRTSIHWVLYYLFFLTAPVMLLLSWWGGWGFDLFLQVSIPAFSTLGLLIWGYHTYRKPLSDRSFTTSGMTLCLYTLVILGLFILPQTFIFDEYGTLEAPLLDGWQFRVMLIVALILSYGLLHSHYALFSKPTKDVWQGEDLDMSVGNVFSTNKLDQYGASNMPLVWSLHASRVIKLMVGFLLFFAMLSGMANLQMGDGGPIHMDLGTYFFFNLILGICLVETFVRRGIRTYLHQIAVVLLIPFITMIVGGFQILFVPIDFGSLTEPTAIIQAMALVQVYLSFILLMYYTWASMRRNLSRQDYGRASTYLFGFWFFCLAGLILMVMLTISGSEVWEGIIPLVIWSLLFVPVLTAYYFTSVARKRRSILFVSHSGTYFKSAISGSLLLSLIMGIFPLDALADAIFKGEITLFLLFFMLSYALFAFLFVKASHHVEFEPTER